MSAPPLRPGFWRDTPLAEMSPEEWEALCDGCGKCCLIKLEDADNEGDVYYTNVACRLLDVKTCRCKDYPNRKRKVADCIVLDLKTLAEAATWLPFTCAYRRLYEGKPLPAWHPLLTGDPDSPHEAWISVRGRALSETEVQPEDWERHVFDWDRWSAEMAEDLDLAELCKEEK